jgi:hypothetical protein
MPKPTKPATWIEIQNLCDLYGLELRQDSYWQIPGDGYHVVKRGPKHSALHMIEDASLSEWIAVVEAWVNNKFL